MSLPRAADDTDATDGLLVIFNSKTWYTLVTGFFHKWKVFNRLFLKKSTGVVLWFHNWLRKHSQWPFINALRKLSETPQHRFSRLLTENCQSPCFMVFLISQILNFPSDSHSGELFENGWKFDYYNTCVYLNKSSKKVERDAFGE